MSTNIERYWVDNTYKLSTYTSQSEINSKFAALMDESGISYATEFKLENYRYDFKVGDTLIEINPWVFHNSTWNPVGDSPKSNRYHLDKTNCAIRNGFRCIHIWDWDDWGKIIDLLRPKKKIYARECEIREISIGDANVLLKDNHLQGVCVYNNVCAFGMFHKGTN